MKRLIAMLMMLVLLLAACGAEVAPPKETAPTQAAGTVTVTNVDELLAAIVPGNVITLEPGEYRLDQAKGYGKSESPYYTWENYGLGSYGLQIQYVNGLTIQGAGKDLTQLTINDKVPDVLRISNCNAIELRDMTLGHTEQTEACQGGVIRMEDSDNMVMRNLGLFGCGTLGVQAYRCENMAMEHCEIYDCSIGGVQISQCQTVKITDSDFRDLGKEAPVMHVFNISGSSGVEVAGCSIADNYVDHLIWADGSIAFQNNVFSSNRVSNSAFCLPGAHAVFENNTFSENELRNWYASDSSVAVDSQGNEVAFEEPVAETTEVTPGVATPVTTGEQKQVRVNNVEDFLKAIASDTCIILDAALIDQSQAKSYQEAQSLEQMQTHQPADNPNYYWVNNYDGPSLVISGVENLTILAEGDDRTAHTLSAIPRYADVLTFENCRAITLQGFTAGHTKEQGYCTGGVFAFNNCTDILVDNCGMYGCGTEGVNADSFPEYPDRQQRNL